MRYAIALAAMALLASLPPAARAQRGSSVLRWEHIGHIADQKVAWLAVPPDGSASGLLFARTAGTPYSSILDASNPGTGQPTPGTTYRSRDGGKTWEAVTDAPGRVVLPAGGAPAFSLARDGVYRSSDLGASWSAVLPLATEQLVLSPTFGQDGIAFALGQDQLWRTTDTGRTWAHLDPGQGQIVIATALSPAFGSDHTLFAAAVTARPATQQPEPPPTDNIDSAGLLVSQDGGTTWTQVSDGLQTDDGPYHQVVAIGVSPNFAADQTVYVTGLGPWLPPDRAGELCGTCALPSVATFATHDAGGAWQVVASGRRQVPGSCRTHSGAR
jgi:hypothetical protein